VDKNKEKMHHLNNNNKKNKNETDLIDALPMDNGVVRARQASVGI
jgi:hypothetical protein